MHLAAHDHRVDRLAHVVGHAVAHHEDVPGVGIDLDLGDMAPVRERVGVDVGHLGRIQRGHVLTLGRASALGRGKLDDVHAAIGADDGEAPILEHDIGGRRFQHFGGRLAPLLDHAGRREQDRLTLGIQAARTAGAAAGGDAVGVALDDTDLLARNAELIHRELHVGRLVALPGGLGADQHVDKTVLGEADFGAFGRRAAGRLQVVCHADATAAAPLGGFGAALLEPGPVHGLEASIEHDLEVAAVVGLADRRLVRHRFGADHVDAAQLDAVDLEVTCSLVDQAFHEIVALGPSGAAIGVHRDGVGEHADDVGIHRLEAIHAGEHAGASAGRDHRRERGQIGAHVGDVAGPQRQELVVGVQRHLAHGQVVTAMRVREECLAPL